MDRIYGEIPGIDTTNRYSIYVTEGTEAIGNEPGKEYDFFGQNLMNDSNTAVIGSISHGAGAVLRFNFALYKDHGPRSGGCANCIGLVAVYNDTKQIAYTANYYVLGHLSKFLTPGARRIDATSVGNELHTVAFKNPGPNASIVVLAVNNSGSSRRVGLRWHGQVGFYDMPRYAVATFVWPAPSDTSIPPVPVPPDTGDGGVRLIEAPNIPVLKPSATATISFTVQNTGDAAWPSDGSTTLVRVDGQALGIVTPQRLLHPIPRGGLAQWRFTVTAPQQPGVYDGVWQLTSHGKPMGERIRLAVVVLPQGSDAGLAQLISAMIADAQQQFQDTVNAYWEDLRRRIEERIKEEIQREIRRQLAPWCGTPPAGLVLVTGAVWWRRRRRENGR